MASPVKNAPLIDAMNVGCAKQPQLDHRLAPHALHRRERDQQQCPGAQQRERRGARPVTASLDQAGGQARHAPRRASPRREFEAAAPRRRAIPGASPRPGAAPQPPRPRRRTGFAIRTPRPGRPRRAGRSRCLLRRPLPTLRSRGRVWPGGKRVADHAQAGGDDAGAGDALKNPRGDENGRARRDGREHARDRQRSGAPGEDPAAGPDHRPGSRRSAACSLAPGSCR